MDRGKNQWEPSPKDREASRVRERFMAWRRGNGARLVAKAIKNGELPPAKKCKCVDCGVKAFCYDHRDYRKPLMVDPVCKRCDSMRGPGLPYCEPDSKTYKKLLEQYKKIMKGRPCN